MLSKIQVAIHKCFRRSELLARMVQRNPPGRHALYDEHSTPFPLLQKFNTNTRWAYTLVLIGKTRGGCLVMFLVLPKFTVSEAYRRRLDLRLQTSSSVSQKAQLETRPSSSEDQTARAPGLNVVLGGEQSRQDQTAEVQDLIFHLGVELGHQSSRLRKIRQALYQRSDFLRLETDRAAQPLLE